ncbi:uncharacterized protein HKW66_Vig0254560 [Vigna angularis]|uniref:Uncharacterized protein n=1 Tax=Phaseolus angularis TaxID=3914 RepID=A0A8T0K0K4_PHAAN|nr:uncharacterized protein HKW66_Vig0254560 [Vigna angularis]
MDHGINSDIIAPDKATFNLLLGLQLPLYQIILPQQLHIVAEKKESENNSANNLENAHQTLDSSSQLTLTLDSSSKETE